MIMKWFLRVLFVGGIIVGFSLGAILVSTISFRYAMIVYLVVVVPVLLSLLVLANANEARLEKEGKKANEVVR